MPDVITVEERQAIDAFVAKAKKERRKLTVPTGAFTPDLYRSQWQRSDASSTWARVHYLHGKGVAPAEIATQLGIKISTVGYHLRRKNQAAGMNLTRDKVAALKARGSTAKEIAAELKIAVNTVHYHLRRL